jgi:DNA-binding PadR family transcriptional regulator
VARTSQTELAVLGALSVEPMTGYRVRAEITETLGHFWQESFGQIYPTLSALATAGLVERGPAPGTPYRITAAGEQRLRELLAEPFRRPAPRNPLLLRLFFGDHVDPGLVRHWLTEALHEAEDAAARYEQIRHEMETGPDVAGDGRFRLMTVLAGRHGARAQADWAREALALLDGPDAPHASGPPHAPHASGPPHASEASGAPHPPDPPHAPPHAPDPAGSPSA